jgi:hypothetical protein
MLKPLTLSLSLAVAFGLSSLSFAHGPSKVLPSGQAPAPSAQAAPSAQESCGGGCETAGPVKKCRLLELFKHRPKCYTYEWVLVKKRVHHPLFGGHGNECGGCGDMTCEACGAAIPSAQGPSPQGLFPAPQSFGAPQALYAPTAHSYAAPLPLGAGQAGVPAAAPMAAPAPAPVADPATEPPQMPSEPKQADAGGLLLLNPSGF